VRRALFRSRVSVVAGAVGLLVALVLPALAEEPTSHLSRGAVLAPGLAPPGWVADHLASWVYEHPAYAASCRTDEVVVQLEYLEKLVERDQDLRDTVRAQLLHAVVDGNSSAKRHTDVAVDALTPLDNDITTIDRLLVKLTALPACSSAAAAPDMQAVASPPAIDPPQPPAVATAPPEPRVSAAADTAALAPQVSAAADIAARAPQAPATEKPAAATPEGDVVVVRFDSSMRGLTPLSVRRLDTAVAAARDGRKVRIAIDGCETRDAAPDGVDCVERARRLKRMLVDRDVKHPGDLIAEPR
jgi:hypothetical protein